MESDEGYNIYITFFVFFLEHHNHAITKCIISI